MDDRPEQRPEGRLIAVAQKRARLSGRKAADLAGMSEGHWRAIVSGSRSVAAGTWIPVRAPADTLAVMAQVVGVAPEQLDEAGRPDAAGQLRSLQSEQPDSGTDTFSMQDIISDPEALERLGAFIDRVRELQGAPPLGEQPPSDQRDEPGTEGDKRAG